MKRLTSVVSAAAICFLISCNSKEPAKEAAGGGMSEAAKKNLASSHIVSDAFMSGDASKIDSAVAPDFVDHTDRGDMNRDSLKAMISTMKKSFPDMKMNLVNELANDDYVFSEMEFTGTSDGSMGMPKGPYDLHVIQKVKFKDGKAVEHWEYMRNDDAMKMIQAMMPPPADKSKDKKN